jgi:ParB-like chromosome segregation protein Spo0J
VKIEEWDIEKVKPYPGNPRRNDKAVEAVAKSIQAYGWRQPIVVDSAGVVICGHTRLKAAQLLKLKTVPVHVAADLTPQQARAYRLADNKTNEISEWDIDLLPIELGELREGGMDLKLLGFSDKELAEYLREFDTDLEGGGTDAGEAAETIRCPKCGHEFPLE